MSRRLSIPRRTFLKGMGTALSLPLLEAMAPSAKVLAAAAPSGVSRRPRRMAFLYVPNGVNMADWTPKRWPGLDLPFI